MRRAILNTSKALVLLALAIFIFAAATRIYIAKGQYRSFGAIRSYSLLVHRGGVLVSRHVLVWHEIRMVPVATVILVVGCVGFLVVRERCVRLR